MSKQIKIALISALAIVVSILIISFILISQKKSTDDSLEKPPKEIIGSVVKEKYFGLLSDIPISTVVRAAIQKQPIDSIPYWAARWYLENAEYDSNAKVRASHMPVFNFSLYGYSKLKPENNQRVLEVAQILINKGANINAIDTRTGRTALHEAVLFNQIAVVEFLAKNKANPNIKVNQPESVFHGTNAVQLGIKINEMDKNIDYTDIIKIVEKYTNEYNNIQNPTTTTVDKPTNQTENNKTDNTTTDTKSTPNDSKQDELKQSEQKSTNNNDTEATPEELKQSEQETENANETEATPEELKQSEQETENANETEATPEELKQSEQETENANETEATPEELKQSEQETENANETEATPEELKQSEQETENANETEATPEELKQSEQETENANDTKTAPEQAKQTDQKTNTTEEQNNKDTPLK